jgi:diaminopimelate epimerase
MIRADATGNTFLIVNEAVPKELRSLWINDKKPTEDGVIWIDHDLRGFSMDYYNRDGSSAALCGNGTRSVFCYLLRRKEINANEWFGLHTEAGILKGKALSVNEAMVEMPMPKTLATVQWKEHQGLAVRVGVPHLVFSVSSHKALEDWDFLAGFSSFSGHKALPEGANVNCFFKDEQAVFNRTFERGVNAETLSCGTGCVAVAWAIQQSASEVRQSYSIYTRGGLLEVIVKDGNFFLKGKVEFYELV